MGINLYRAETMDEFGSDLFVMLRLDAESAQRLLLFRDSIEAVLKEDNDAILQVSDATPIAYSVDDVITAIGEYPCDDTIKVSEEEFAGIGEVKIIRSAALIGVAGVSWEIQGRHYSPSGNMTPLMTWGEIADAAGDAGRCRSCGAVMEVMRLFTSIERVCPRDCRKE